MDRLYGAEWPTPRSGRVESESEGRVEGPVQVGGARRGERLGEWSAHGVFAVAD